MCAIKEEALHCLPTNKGIMNKTQEKQAQHNKGYQGINKAHVLEHWFLKLMFLVVITTQKIIMIEIWFRKSYLMSGTIIKSIYLHSMIGISPNMCNANVIALTLCKHVTKSIRIIFQDRTKAYKYQCRAILR